MKSQARNAERRLPQEMPEKIDSTNVTAAKRKIAAPRRRQSAGFILKSPRTPAKSIRMPTAIDSTPTRLNEMSAFTAARAEDAPQIM